MVRNLVLYEKRRVRCKFSAASVSGWMVAALRFRDCEEIEINKKDCKYKNAPVKVAVNENRICHCE